MSPSAFPRPQRPTGIIRTLPYFGAKDSEHNAGEAGKAYRRMMRTLKAIEVGRAEYFYVAFPSKPTTEVLHCYLIVGGKVRVRCNISHWISGDQMGRAVTCWDDSVRKAKWWAVVTGPVSWPPHDILRRGFQGFRYTGPLWDDEGEL